MANFLRHTACEHCGSSDAMAVYDDSSLHCYSCGYHVHPTTQSRVRERQERSKMGSVVHTEQSISLPEDYDPFYFPLEALQWVAQYELTQEDLKRNRAG